MGKITEIANFDEDIYQIEIDDAVVGGVNGISNKAAKSLANRTKWLKDIGLQNAIQTADLNANQAANQARVDAVETANYYTDNKVFDLNNTITTNNNSINNRLTGLKFVKGDFANTTVGLAQFYTALIQGTIYSIQVTILSSTGIFYVQKDINYANDLIDNVLVVNLNDNNIPNPIHYYFIITYV